jgi:hypothetical protein
VDTTIKDFITNNSMHLFLGYCVPGSLADRYVSHMGKTYKKMADRRRQNTINYFNDDGEHIATIVRNSEGVFKMYFDDITIIQIGV